MIRLMITLALGLFISACSKESGCTNTPAANEDAALVAFNTSHGISATKHSSGLYYQIVRPGNSQKPTTNRTLYVKYKGTRLDDTVFDQATNPGATGFGLYNLVQAWQIALPMIGKGGKILITVPSSLGYGCQGSSSSSDSSKIIAPNTPLYFEIELEDFI